MELAFDECRSANENKERVDAVDDRLLGNERDDNERGNNDR